MQRRCRWARRAFARRSPISFTSRRAALRSALGLGARPGFAEAIAERLATLTGLPLATAPNKFEALASQEAEAHVHGAITALATGLYKIASDIRLSGSGPRAGFAELALPENEPGSSIMPGKVNPTQIEALTMVCARVFGNETTLVFAASQGHFELNAMKPIVAQALLESIDLLADAIDSFTERCVVGLQPETSRLATNLERSLMLVTALVPTLGYDRAAEIAKAAHANGTSLREEAQKIAGMQPDQFDQIVRPERMLSPQQS